MREVSGSNPEISAGLIRANEREPVRQLAAERTLLGFINGIRKFRSVVEFGCGLANWLRVAQELGATEIRGYDTAELPLAARGLARTEFRVADLEQFIELEKTFDLAICLEIAQQLSPRAGVKLVKTLCSAADWVLFSAGIPLQDDTGPLNENWMEYWAGLFTSNDFLSYDILRDKVWHRKEIPFYYRQNACLYVRRGAHQALKGFEPSPCPPSMIHPELYLKLLNWLANRRKHSPDWRVFLSDCNEFYQGAQILGGADPVVAAVHAKAST